jgi:hypothetical protein
MGDTPGDSAHAGDGVSGIVCIHVAYTPSHEFGHYSNGPTHSTKGPGPQRVCGAGPELQGRRPGAGGLSNRPLSAVCSSETIPPKGLFIDA